MEIETEVRNRCPATPDSIQNVPFRLTKYGDR
jgi:hypothetical protein